MSYTHRHNAPAGVRNVNGEVGWESASGRVPVGELRFQGSPVVARGRLDFVLRTRLQIRRAVVVDVPDPRYAETGPLVDDAAEVVRVQVAEDEELVSGRHHLSHVESDDPVGPWQRELEGEVTKAW